MSAYYQKVRMDSRRDGSFKGFGLIVRANDAESYYLVAKGGGGDEALRETLRGEGLTFSSAEGTAIHCFSVIPNASFTTAIMLFEDTPRTDTLRDISFTMIGQPIRMNDVFTVDLDSVFMYDVQARADISGVAVKAGYTDTISYTGMAGYHGNQHRGFNTPRQADKPWRIGVELELYARNAAAKTVITSARSNWFMCERDSSVNERVNGVSDLGIEMKTIPLKACDATDVNFWNEPMTRLKSLALSKGFASTGLHVHISKEVLGSTEEIRQKNLRKLQFFYVYLVENDTEAHRKNVAICGREKGYGCDTPNSYMTDVARFVKKAGIKHGDINAEALEELCNGIYDKCSHSRWDINLNTWNSYGTIEFRKGKGIISQTRMAAICTWWEQMCLYCARTPAERLDFNEFFTSVCSASPAVAHFFAADEEV